MRWTMPVACLLTLTACAGNPPAQAPAASTPPVATPAAAPAKPQLASGVILANFDRNVRPQDDFYRYVNGGWLERTQIPPDRSNYGTFTMLADEVEKNLKTIVEQAAATPGTSGSDSQMIGDLYASYMDEATAERNGPAALQAELAAIDAIKDRAGLVEYFGRTQLRYVNAPPGIENFGAAAPLAATVFADAKHPDVNALYVDQFGLGMPDRDYYLKKEGRFAEVRGKYHDYARELLELGGRKDAARSAARVVALETRLATAQWAKVELRDPNKVYNPMDLAAAAKLTPGFDWSRWMAGAGIQGTGKLIVGEPSYFKAMAAAVREVPLETWKDYLRVHVTDDYAALMGGKYEQARFAFRETTLTGVQEMRPRWKRGIQQVEFVMGQMLGRVYVGQYFPPESKAQMQMLVSNLLTTFGESIDQLAWMSGGTKLAAHQKLAKFTVKIGYPDKWPPKPEATIRRDDLVGNVMRTREGDRRIEFAKIGQPVDRTEWTMTPQTVNAYYNPLANEIVFPAAILQPPFFDPKADNAVNYGAIVGVIGHEVSHGFDDEGRKFDGDGVLRDWWTADDNAKFQEKAHRLSGQYSAFSPIPGMNVNGDLTLGENIGDLSGLAMAYKAYHRSLAGSEAPVLDGYTGDQRFYIGWAQVWARKYREDELRKRLLTDPHSPSEYRVNGIVRNMEQFDRAFDVKPGDKLYLPADEMVRIW
ncbi:MAG TPA: M13 family metallopeptidase [Steroidobacteraceae bacterium]|nr:M13 family metallopeptidase [Steroidobacteraceae bacterium]